MKTVFHLACAYLKNDKKQTAALFFCIVLSSALLAGMSGLFASGKQAAKNRAEADYGRWHYSMRAEGPWMKAFAQSEKNPEQNGYHIEQAGMLSIRKVLEEPIAIDMVYADAGYLDMMGRTLEKGSYPAKKQEIAMDAGTLKNLGVSEELGTKVTLDGEIFKLCGILSGAPGRLAEFQGDAAQVFVHETLDYGTTGSFVYLRFDESRRPYEQMYQFCRTFGLALKDISRNNGLYDYGLAGPPDMINVIKTGISDKAYGLPYIWGQLNATGQLAETVILAALALFGAFAVYSLFQVSVIRRMAQYSVMQTLGMTDGQGFAVLLAELGSICIMGYPPGCAAGNFAARLLYEKIGRIFILQKKAAMHIQGAGQVQAVSELPDAGAYGADWTVMWKGFLFFAAVTAAVSAACILRMRQMTIRQLISRENAAGNFAGRQPSRKIYSICRSSLTGILTHKFMFARKGTFAGILLSLSVGSILFLGACYVTENTKTNYELTLRADDGLGSDIQVYEQSDRLSDVIPEETAAQMQEIPGISRFHPVRYQLGEIRLENGTYEWTDFYGGMNPKDQELMEKYNGIVTKTGDDDYAVKVNIYGYDDAMLEELQAYLMDGEINPEHMRRDNTVIVKLLMDGQGNYGGADISAGDRISLKTVTRADVPQEALCFDGKSSWYQEQSLGVCALVTRPLAKADTFIGDCGTDRLDIIMTNEQMERCFGVSGWRTISISVKDGADAGQVSAQLCALASGISRCVVRDYTQQIKEQNLYLTQKMFFYYGIAAVLLGISLLHIMNSMQYLIAARRREFGILRAMGITDAGFLKMIAKEGLRYGACSAAVVMIVYFFVQKVLYYFMVHVYLYLHPRWSISWQALAGAVALNVAVCVAVTLLSAATVLKKEIAVEIRE